MRGATECAKRVRLLFSSLRSRLGKVSPPAAGDPVTQLLLGILSRDTPEAKAAEGLERLRSFVVDYNELRVIPPIELADTLGDFPDARLKCEDISRALNTIFAIEHSVNLDRLADMPRKDMLAYLERIDGLEPYTAARIRLLGLGKHAVPLDEAMWAYARRAELVSARTSLPEAQQFLERQVAEDDAVEFFALLRKQAWSELGSAVRKGEVERIRSVPPDRSTRNMLQMITAAGTLEPVVLAESVDEDEPPPAPESPPARRPAPPASARTSVKARNAGAERAGERRAGAEQGRKSARASRPRAAAATRSTKSGRARSGSGRKPSRSRSDGKPPSRKAATGTG